MIGVGSTLSLWTGVVIAVALAAAVVRLLLWHRSAPPSGNGPRWRLFALIVLQVAAAALLWMTLFPPALITGAGRLIVLTAEAPATVDTAPGDILVALPEARPMEGATRVPDLATALRRFPEAASIEVLGQGLPPRDQRPVPVRVTFDPPPQPRGVISLTIPEPVAPGAGFSVGGRIGTLASGTIELLDPSGAVADKTPIAAGQSFVVRSSARSAGLALFTLRLKDRTDALVEEIPIPLETLTRKQPRVLVLAGGPGPETKYLRRWAEDAGIDLSLQIDLGGGAEVHQAPVSLTASSLSQVDLIVIDDRRWEALGAGQRGALISAVSDGLGLLLRPTGPLSAATQRDWSALGVSLAGGDDTLPLQLDATTPTPTAGEAETEGDAQPPALTRRDFTIIENDAVSLLRDASGMTLANWRARGSGRVGVWTVTDSYVLVLTGSSDRYGELWSTLFSALARPEGGGRFHVDSFSRVGQRMALCGLTGPASVSAPGGSQRLVVDPASFDGACAAFWPDRTGWHLARDDKSVETAFYVQAADAAGSLSAAQDREATLALASATTPDRAAVSGRRAGSPWPWFAGLLIALAGLWWLERNRRGATGADRPA